MKHLNILLLGIGLIIACSAWTIFSKASTNLKEESKFQTNCYCWIKTSLFRIGTTPSDPLDNSINWSDSNNCSSGCNGGAANICKVCASYTGTAPTKQQVLDALQAEYDLDVANSTFIQDQETWVVNINGVDVTLEVFLRA